MKRLFVFVTFGLVVGELMVGQTEPALLEVLHPKAVPPLRPLDHHPGGTITTATLSMPRQHYIHHGDTIITTATLLPPRLHNDQTQND